MNTSAPDEKNVMTRRAAPADAGLRLDQFWVRELADAGPSRERIKEWIQDGLAAIDGKPCKKPGQRLDGRERLTLDAPDFSTEIVPEPEALPLDVIHRDETLAVVVKPAGLTTHPAPSQPEGTLVNRLLHHFPELAPEVSGMTGERPGIVHRLDKDTSGLMLVALTEAARLELAGAFAERRVRKTYLALVHGRPVGDEAGPLGPDAGFIDLPMGRHPSIRTKMAVLKKGGREARTSWRRLWTDRRGRASLLAVDLHTGRTHQIRVHLAHMGHPLLGDPVYGPARHAAWLKQQGPLAALAPRQMLHAFRLAFEHPESGADMAFTQPPPEDFLALLRALAADCQRVVVTGMPSCGKSALLSALAGLGAPTFSADACVAGLYAPSGSGAQQLARVFGRDILTPEGAVDRRKLLDLLLSRPSARRELEDAVHPMVRHELAAFYDANAGRELAVAEVPLYFESGWGGKASARSRREADVVVGVRCPEELRRGAFREARGIAPEVLAAFESWQWPEERKLAACDEVVENSGALAELERAAEALLNRLAALRGERQERFLAELDSLLEGVAREGAVPTSPGHGPDRGGEGLDDGDADDWGGEEDGVAWEVTAE